MSVPDRKGAGNGQGVVIRKEEVVAEEGHGGAWKVAYADFVTAMMAFFLLMWLLNATTEDQRKGLADYFSPNSLLSHASSGTGDPFGGHTAFDEGALVSDRGVEQVLDGSRPRQEEQSEEALGPDAGRPGTEDDIGSGVKPQAARAPASVSTPPLPAGATPPPATSPASGPATAQPTEAAPPPGPLPAGSAGQTPTPPTEAEMREALERKEKAEFDRAAQQIRDAVRADPTLVDLARQLAIDITPEGLRIQILDAEHRPMFELGSAEPNERAKLLLQKVTPVLARLPQDISVDGHTDAAQFPGPNRTNWELSTERANATRRLLIEGGLPESRIRSITGHADRDLLLPDDPLAAANRRIAIVVLRDNPPSGQPGGTAGVAGTPGG